MSVSWWYHFCVMVVPCLCHGGMVVNFLVIGSFFINYKLCYDRYFIYEMIVLMRCLICNTVLMNR